MLEDFQHLGDTFWQPDLRMCLFAVGISPSPEKPADDISTHMHLTVPCALLSVLEVSRASNLPFAPQP